MTIREKCEELLRGMDEDTLEYIVSMIEDQVEDLEAITEGITGFILSSDFVDTEEAAEELCKQIIAAVQQEQSGTTPVIDGPQLLKNKLVISQSSADLLPPHPPEKEDVPVNFGRAVSHVTGKSRKVTAASHKVHNQALELEEELEAARVCAARARALEGAYNGALGNDIVICK